MSKIGLIVLLVTILITLIMFAVAANVSAIQPGLTPPPTNNPATLAADRATAYAIRTDIAIQATQGATWTPMPTNTLAPPTPHGVPGYPLPEDNSAIAPPVWWAATPAPLVVERACMVVLPWADRLHVRSGPGLDYPVITHLADGARVVVLNQVGEWLQINAGWIAAQYCEPEL
jgi:uncharacterized protein YgiM (DUF1202 family)